MKYAILALFTLVVIGLGVSSASAAPFNPNFKNPNVVAFYPTGLHGVPDEPGFTHEGKDLVMRAGNSGNFQQWFYGTSDEAAGLTEGDHTIWKPTDDGCKGKATLIPDPFPEWGDYLQPGIDYCVKTNDFHSSFQHGI